MRFQAHIAAAIALALVGCASAQYRNGEKTDIAAVSDVVEKFRVAILNKDRDAYMSLFFSDSPQKIGWQAVVDDALLEKIHKDRPQAIRARHRPENNFVALIDSVVASTKIEEEQISNLRIESDGEIASAFFDYKYVSDGKVLNRGREHWQLVRTEGGWKIFSVVYSIREPQP